MILIEFIILSIYFCALSGGVSRPSAIKWIQTRKPDFNTIFTKNYGESKESRLAEFEDVLASGYVNTVFLADRDSGYFNEALSICKNNSYNAFDIG